MISKVRLDIATQEALRIILGQLRNPTIEEIEKDLNEIIDDRDLNDSFLSQDRVRYQYREPSSASKFNRIISQAWTDLNVIDTALTRADEKISAIFNQARLEFENLERRLDKLISRADTLVLASPETAGLVGTFTEDFKDLTFVDQSQTTCVVDVRSQTAVGEYTGERLTSQIIDPSRIEQSDITVLPLDPASVRAPGTRDSRVLDMLTEDLHPWIYTLGKIGRAHV